jgi:hypothetical protein
MRGISIGDTAQGGTAGVGSFHVHRGHAFEGFRLVGEVLEARCACGQLLDVADVAYADCPECDATSACTRCGGSGVVVDHTALAWRLPAT